MCSGGEDYTVVLRASASDVSRHNDWAAAATTTATIKQAHLAEHIDVKRFREDLYRVQRRHAVQIARVDVHLHHLFATQLRSPERQYEDANGRKK